MVTNTQSAGQKKPRLWQLASITHMIYPTWAQPCGCSFSEKQSRINIIPRARRNGPGEGREMIHKVLRFQFKRIYSFNPNIKLAYIACVNGKPSWMGIMLFLIKCIKQRTYALEYCWQWLHRNRHIPDCKMPKCCFVGSIYNIQHLLPLL